MPGGSPVTSFSYSGLKMLTSPHRETLAPWKGRRSTWDTGEYGGRLPGAVAMLCRLGPLGHSYPMLRPRGRRDLVIGGCSPIWRPEPAAAAPVRDTGGREETESHSWELSPYAARTSGPLRRGTRSPRHGGLLGEFARILVRSWFSVAQTAAGLPLLARARDQLVCKRGFLVSSYFQSSSDQQGGVCRPQVSFAHSCHCS